MSRSGDNAPVSHTCPKIDDVINSLHELYISEEAMSKGELKIIEDTMENIRKDNQQLRDWGNKEYERAEEAEKDRDYYQNLAERHESDAKDLEKQVAQLEKELSEA